MIGLIQVGEQAIADRYAYVPLIGIFVMAVWGAADLADSRQFSFRSRAKTAAIVLGIFSLFTFDQLRYWRSAVDLWAHTVDVTKDNFLGRGGPGRCASGLGSLRGGVAAFPEGSQAQAFGSGRPSESGRRSRSERPPA